MNLGKDNRRIGPLDDHLVSLEWIRMADEEAQT
jgi:hypothetical protein